MTALGPLRGTYNAAPDERVTGSVQTGTIDLGVISDPVLSFSSYYETEGLGTERDTKMVEIRVRNQDGSWGDWRPLHQVHGLSGGYGQWRSQAVNLDAYAKQLVQIRFSFDSIDGEDNGRLGWLIDDVSIGHDQDRDTLPDRLEEVRTDMRIASMSEPVRILDGETTTGYVARTWRHEASDQVMEAIISHPDPDDLKVYVGQVSASGGQVQTLVYDTGTVVSNSCAATQWWQRGEYVEETSDGLIVSMDMVQCFGSAFSTTVAPRDWFVEVHDTATDDETGWIDMVRFVTAGKTDMAQSDTDRDRKPDGQEINLQRDPLGIDGDRDDLHESVDPNDGVPNWAPAVSLQSTNFKWSILFTLGDAPGPMEHTKFYGDGQELKVTRKGPSEWKVSVPTASPPSLIRGEWRDVYGNEGYVDWDTGWQPLHDVKGLDGGYKKWRSQVDGPSTTFSTSPSKSGAMASLDWPGEILLVAGVATLAFILLSFWFSSIMAKRGWSWQIRARPKR